MRGRPPRRRPRRLSIPLDGASALDAHDVGRRGEALAARHLMARGWTILDRNYRDGPREVDLVARRASVLAFVEVKTRSGTGFGHPLEAVTRRKRRELATAARRWLRDHRGAGGRRVRFDAVAVHLDRRGGVHVEHVPDAWRPGG